MTVRTHLGGLVLLMIVMAGCSGSAGTSDTSTAPVPTDEVTTTGPATTEPPAVTTTVAPPTTVVPRLEFHRDTIEITSPDSGGGDRPQLRWEPVEGASQYHVTVFAPNGRAYWATQTGATSVHVGGEPQLDDDAAGPSILEGMTWQVVAVDDDRTPLAASERSPISP